MIRFYINGKPLDAPSVDGRITLDLETLGRLADVDGNIVISEEPPPPREPGDVESNAVEDARRRLDASSEEDREAASEFLALILDGLVTAFNEDRLRMVNVETFAETVLVDGKGRPGDVVTSLRVLTTRAQQKSQTVADVVDERVDVDEASKRLFAELAADREAIGVDFSARHMQQVGEPVLVAREDGPDVLVAVCASAQAYLERWPEEDPDRRRDVIHDFALSPGTGYVVTGEGKILGVNTRELEPGRLGGTRYVLVAWEDLK